MTDEFAGSLRERVLIERAISTRVDTGRAELDWESIAWCHAAVVPDGTGSEGEGMSLSAMPRFRVTIRAREGIAVDQRVSWRGRKMMVRQLHEDPRSKDRMLLRCEEVR